jgi:hypothetical protein
MDRSKLQFNSGRKTREYLLIVRISSLPGVLFDEWGFLLCRFDNSCRTAPGEWLHFQVIFLNGNLVVGVFDATYFF